VLLLLMAALFRSLRDALVVMLTVPLALIRRRSSGCACSAVRVPAARPALDDRLHHDDRRDRQPRDPAGRPHAQRAARRQALEDAIRLG
jgi:hypothetical protein